MTGSAGMRAAVLGAVALVAIAVALAVSHRTNRSSNLPAPAGYWYTALATPYASSESRKKTACGVVIKADTVGVANPVLPCGVKLYVEYNDTQVLTHVIDRGHTAPGRDFDLTQALAKLLRVQGTQTIRWRFAR